MKYISMENTTVPVSTMIFGTAIQPLKKGENADDLLDKIIEKGITTFDTARSYGKCEESFGIWVKKRGIRNKINILTKGCNPHQTGLTFTPESLRMELEESLRQLQVDYVDFYALHRDDTSVDVGVYIDILNEFVREGKIRNLGASNWTYERMAEANRYAKEHDLLGFSFGSPAFSLAEVVRDPYGGSVHLSGEGKKTAREWFRDNKIPVFSYSAFARGFMSGKYRTDMKEPVTDVLSTWTCQEYVCPENLERLRRAEELAKEKKVTVSQINLAWIMGQDFICCPIFSPSTIEHLLENLKGMELSLTENEMKWLNLEENLI